MKYSLAELNLVIKLIGKVNAWKCPCWMLKWIFFICKLPTAYQKNTFAIGIIYIYICMYKVAYPVCEEERQALQGWARNRVIMRRHAFSFRRCVFWKSGRFNGLTFPYRHHYINVRVRHIAYDAAYTLTVARLCRSSCHNRIFVFARVTHTDAYVHTYTARCDIVSRISLYLCVFTHVHRWRRHRTLYTVLTQRLRIVSGTTMHSRETSCGLEWKILCFFLLSSSLD